MLDLLPQWLRDGIGDDGAFWIGYLSNGKHLAWYASIQYTLLAALIGGATALVLGLITAALRNGGPLPARLIASGYMNIMRGVPDVLFFLFFPIAVEQGVEWLAASQLCTADSLAANAGQWPPCAAANWHLTSAEYLVLAGVSLGIVYGAFAGNVMSGALDAVPRGQLEAARAFGMSRLQILFRIHLRQMWIYALPGLSNCWMTLLKATSLLSLLQILDPVALAHRLGAANFSSLAGLVHGDWRAGYYLALLAFYLLLTFVSERVFAALSRWAARGVTVPEHGA
ncbi:MAG TPA: ABC transporter permease subunit [Devosia sp.]|nr:ABC transporter permease subunit [Devosia sp.]